MCGRYNLHDMPAIDTLRQLIPGLSEVVPPSRRYNVAPGTDISAVFLPDPESDPQLNLLWWGFRPAWVGEGGPTSIIYKADAWMQASARLLRIR
ncbi:SOS response-associated peptidase family protein [Halomonas sp. V046]|uniref:SOS response-associated peptidase family protein n=1 Tax=Halomonas sp. V046 TaxID=3459611 RepID=UPI004044DD72